MNKPEYKMTINTTPVKGRFNYGKAFNYDLGKADEDYEWCELDSDVLYKGFVSGGNSEKEIVSGFISNTLKLIETLEEFFGKEKTYGYLALEIVDVCDISCIEPELIEMYADKVCNFNFEGLTPLDIYEMFEVYRRRLYDHCKVLFSSGWMTTLYPYKGFNMVTSGVFDNLTSLYNFFSELEYRIEEIGFVPSYWEDDNIKLNFDFI